MFSPRSLLKRPFVYLLLLLGLLSLQVEQLHLAEHDEAEHCHVCFHAKQTQQNLHVGALPAPLAVVAAVTPFAAPLSQSYESPLRRHYRSRAPPVPISSLRMLS